MNRTLSNYPQQAQQPFPMQGHMPGEEIHRRSSTACLMCAVLDGHAHAGVPAWRLHVPVCETDALCLYLIWFDCPIAAHAQMMPQKHTPLHRLVSGACTSGSV
jgi:hypothetical protein